MCERPLLLHGDIHLAGINPKIWDQANHSYQVRLVFKPAPKHDSDQGVSRLFPEPRNIDNYHRIDIENNAIKIMKGVASTENEFLSFVHRKSQHHLIINLERIMTLNFNKQPTVIVTILLFSIGIMLPCHSFAAGGKKATQAALNAEIIDRTNAFNILQNQINNIQIQIDSVQVDSLIYEIGEAGPADGIVFYVTDGGLHGLEAAPQNTGFTDWGCYDAIIVGADATAVGTGAQNTSDILAGCDETGIAAELADDYALNGYTDWFLPSKDELNLMYNNIGQGASPPLTNVGSFDAFDYMSSTQSDREGVWWQSFDDGGQVIFYKLYPIRVRAVRAF